MSWREKVDKDFVVSPACLKIISLSKEAKNSHKEITNYLSGKLFDNILDVGERNPLTILLENTYNIKIDNTDGDLDVGFSAPKKNYDVIIFSHVVEHLFNPLFCLMELKKLLKPNGVIFIATPRCPENLKLNWSKGHFHELDEYRMNKLVERSGLKIIDKYYYKRNIGGFKGVRPILKKILYKNAIYTIINQE